MKFLALIPLVLAAAPASQEPAPSLRPSGIAARINGEIITWDEVELMIRTVAPELRTTELRRQVRRQLAEQELFLQEAKHYNIVITEAQVDADLEAERKQSNLTPDAFLKNINQEGISISEYRTRLRRQRTIATLMSRLATEPLRNPNPKLQLLLEFVSPEEMRDYFEKHPEQFKAIRQMDLVFLAFQFQTPEERDEKVRLAESIRRRVKEGSPLFVLALAHMDPNLMPVKDKMRMPAYANLAYEDSPFSPKITEFLFKEMKEGTVSDPVVDGNSVSLFHLQRRIIEEERTFEAAQPFIRRQLESAKRRHNQRVLRDDLVRRSFVEPPDIFN